MPPKYDYYEDVHGVHGGENQKCVGGKVQPCEASSDKHANPKNCKVVCDKDDRVFRIFVPLFGVK